VPQPAKPDIFADRVWRVFPLAATFKGEMMCEVTAEQKAQLDALLSSDRGPLTDSVASLLAGEEGDKARRLVLCSLSRRLEAGYSIRAAVVLALGDAMRHVRGDYDDA
jgi:hypothetical protein